MPVVLSWGGGLSGSPPAPDLTTAPRPLQAPEAREATRPAPGPSLPPALATLVWRGTELDRRQGATVPSGFPPLDAELPGRGWPCGALTELLGPATTPLTWRLLGRALSRHAQAGPPIALVAPPLPPHLPGLLPLGLAPRQLLWIQADTVAERLWCAEQLIQSQACSALLVWLPQVRPEAVRRLQVGAQAFDGLAFLMRPLAARHEASAAPLRLAVEPGPDWHLRLQILKRRGPRLDQPLQLEAVPQGLEALITPRLRQPRLLLTRPAGVPARSPRDRHALGRAATAHPARQPLAR